MNEQLRNQISAFLDDELPLAESELLVRRLGRDDAMHATATRYLLIGQVLRGEALGAHPLAFNERVRRGMDSVGDDTRALAEETATTLAGRMRQRWRRGVGGVAAAAAVALVAIVGLQIVTQRDLPEDAALAVAGTEPDTSTYTVTRQSADPLERAPAVQPPIRLTNYLMSHGEYAGSLGRKTIHSGIVGTSAAQVMGGYMEVSAPAADDAAYDRRR